MPVMRATIFKMPFRNGFARSRHTDIDACRRLACLLESISGKDVSQDELFSTPNTLSMRSHSTYGPLSTRDIYWLFFLITFKDHMSMRSRNL